MLWSSYEVTGVLPQALSIKPEHYSWMGEYIRGFNMLSSMRTYGMQANPISFSEIIRYIEVYRPHDPERYIDLIMMMDRSHLSTSNKKPVEPVKD
jgi:hypothetical protein